MDKLSYDGPIVLAILDGVGLAPDGPGNAVSKARTAFLGKAAREYLHVALEASGEAVGLMAGQMGNSEVGHNTMGVGQAIRQANALVDEAFETGAVFESAAWKEATSRILSTSGNVWGAADGERPTLHFAGIFSDGGVHSNIEHLFKMMRKAYEQGVRRMRVHAVFDGRDVAPQSEPKYIEMLEKFAKELPGADIRLASGGGRMVCVADRYESDWNTVARGWDMMVNGEADFYFKSGVEAIEMLRRIKPGVQDQNLPPFVIVDEMEQPVGRITKGDVVIYFDFRADRAIEIAQAFTYWDFPYFNRGDYRPDDMYFVGMMEYNSDTHVPEHRLVEPAKQGMSLSKFLGEHGVSQYAVSETVKFGHVTYYFDGNSYARQEHEEFEEIESDTTPFEERPWMKSAEIADRAIAEMPNYKFVRLNFPGGDMVGHTANMEATIIAMEAIDLALSRIAAEVDKLGGVLMIVSDHGNAEELVDEKGEAKTSHTTNKVPCIIYDNTENRGKYGLSGVYEPGLANIAATIATLLGLSDVPDAWEQSLIEVK
ncbi:phosphoglycerate mutase (2,3-diphosphoglycerate-independent) [Candidatus Saccharibacteria bacterium]|nr:phosphoglycerate mutase (2,3-diphosphoglycerate-independent) [Candidatus Saccharibacteria bacterium]